MLKKCHAQNAQVYLQPFWRNSLLKCVSQPKITEKLTKNLYFEGSRSFKVINVDSNKKPVISACLIMISSMSVPICNRVHATHDNCSKITTI